METRWGKRLGRYEIVAELGRGAMGVVYKARDPKIDRFVAIKTISLLGQSPEDERDYRQRFFHEAQAAGRMFHPGVVTIFDVGEEPDTHEPYIVMEYIDGSSLDRMLATEGKKLPLEIALQLTQELAEALDYAHAQGVVHRDIKPGNILITEDRHAKIADFGIAKLNLSKLTLPGHALGTPAFMSPEQVAGEAVDRRSDLFSLGVVFYNMLTGFSPFQGNSVTTVVFKVVNRDPLPVTALAAELPAEIDAILARAMAKDPAQRYQRGIDFAMDLGELRQRFPSKGDTRINKWASGNFHERSAEAAKENAPRPSPKSATTKPVKHVGTASRVKSSSPASASTFDQHLLKIAIASVVVFLFFVIGMTMQRPKPKATVAPHAANLAPKPVAPASQPVAAAPPVATKPSAESAKEITTAEDDTPPSRPAAAKVRAIKTARPAPVAALPKLPPKPAAPAPASPSTLAITIDHPFATGQVDVWVDDQLAFSQALHGDAKRRLVVFHGAEGHESGNASVPAGDHRVKVRVQSSVRAYDENQTIQGTFKPGEPRTLSVTFVGHDKDIHLTLE